MTRKALNLVHDLMALLPPRAWAVLSVMAALCIIYVGTRPGPQLPPMGFRFPHQDKVLHFLAYSLLASIIYRAKYPFPADRPPKGSLPWLPIVLVPFVLGLVDEIAQGFTAGRSSDPFDLLADSLAGVTVCILALTWREKARRRLESRRRRRASRPSNSPSRGSLPLQPEAFARKPRTGDPA